MSHQIQFHSKDLDLQRILWSLNPKEQPVDFRLTTVTYGIICASFLAIPFGAGGIQYNTHVEHIFARAHEIKLAMQKGNELCVLFHSASIKLNKWAVNQFALKSRRNEIGNSLETH